MEGTDIFTNIFCAILVGFLILAMQKIFGIFIVGISLILLGLDFRNTIEVGTKTGPKRKIENNLWNRLPFLLVGLFLTITYIIDFINKNTNRNLFKNKIIARLTTAAIAAIIIGRLFFLIASLCAVASRKKHCTLPARTEPEGIAAGLGEKANYRHDGMPVFRYYYENEAYRFVDHDNATAFFSDLSQTFVNDLKNIELYIDPDEPERYYSPVIFRRKGKKLLNFLEILGVIAIIHFFRSR